MNALPRIGHSAPVDFHSLAEELRRAGRAAYGSEDRGLHAVAREALTFAGRVDVHLGRAA